MKKSVMPIFIFLFISFSLLSTAYGNLMSNFDGGPEAWTTWDDPSFLVSDIYWNPTGGNPGGYIYAEDIPIQGYSGYGWRFVSPPSWSGDWSNYKGGVLKFDMQVLYIWEDAPSIHAMNVLIDAPDVGNFLSWSPGTDMPLNEWTHFDIPIVPGNFSVVGTLTFDEIMSNVGAILIKGEASYGPDSTAIDNVMVSQAPEPATMLLLGTGLIGLVGFRRKFKNK